MQIAVDGPAGSGKSTISKKVATIYGLVYLDTGAMYRSAAWLHIAKSIPLDSLATMVNDVKFIFTDNGSALSLEIDGEPVNVTEFIRTPEVTQMVGKVSSIPSLRTMLTEKQKEIALKSDVIMDGRDIGTVVLPKADAKFFLTATPDERANRRLLEWQKKGMPLDFESVKADIIERDHLDSTRLVAPLKKATDAIEIDTTHLTIDEVVAIIGAVVLKLRNGEKLSIGV